jgi:hypothetical protein
MTMEPTAASQSSEQDGAYRKCGTLNKPAAESVPRRMVNDMCLLHNNLRARDVKFAKDHPKNDNSIVIYDN